MIQKVFIILIISLLSCSESKNPVAQDAVDPGATIPIISVPGQVIAGFIDSVDYAFISSFIKQLHLEAIDISADSSFTVWIEVDSGDVDKHITNLLEEPVVTWAKQRGYSEAAQETYILVHFNGEINVADAQNLVSLNRGLVWQKVLFSPRMAVMGVPVGDEQFWIDSLTTYPFVTWAELNYISHISN